MHKRRRSSPDKAQQPLISIASRSGNVDRRLPDELTGGGRSHQRCAAAHLKQVAEPGPGHTPLPYEIVCHHSCHGPDESALGRRSLCPARHALRSRGTSLVSRPHQAGGIHYGPTVDARAAASRFTEPNSQDSLSPGRFSQPGRKGQPFIDAAAAVRSYATSSAGPARRQPHDASTRPSSLLRRCKPPSGAPPQRSASPGYTAQASQERYPVCLRSGN